MKAPNFELKDQDNIVHTLSSYRGKWLVVYFYPEDDTPGCTKEACGFRDMTEEFKKRGVEVVGISKDTVKSHKKFVEKYALPFTLLSDPTLKTIEAFGAWGESTLRNSYLIDPEGNIVKEYLRVTPETHPEEILRDVDNLR
jgi:peroxiredoxin Q/BCP